MATKTKEAAMKAARKALGKDAAEGVDYQLRNTGAGWDFETIPEANEPAKAARAKKAAKASPELVPASVKAKAAKAEKTTKALAAAVKDAPEPAPKRAPRRKLAETVAPKPAGEHPVNKTGLITAMLERPEGATSKQLEDATGWLPHSVRGLLGTLRKKGVKVESAKDKNQPTVYRIRGKAKRAPAPAEVGDVI